METETFLFVSTLISKHLQIYSILLHPERIFSVISDIKSHQWQDVSHFMSRSVFSRNYKTITLSCLCKLVSIMKLSVTINKATYRSFTTVTRSTVLHVGWGQGPDIPVYQDNKQSVCRYFVFMNIPVSQTSCLPVRLLLGT